MNAESAGAQTLRPADSSRLTRAHVLPFVVFMAFLLALSFAGPFIEWKHPDAPWWRRAPEQWLYPVQSLAAFAVLVRFWKSYDFRWSWKSGLAGVLCGALGIGLWLLPTTLYDRLGLTADPDGWMGWLGIAARKEGFDPGIFASPAAWWTSVVLRFFRAVVVVALVEEIFWRGFLMRFALDWEGDCWRQPFGKASWSSFVVVTGLFVLVHSAPDRPAAFLYGSLAYLLCVRGKSLGACVIMHATANLLMGLYIMAYGKYGLW
jgi:CAAX prenyl protease-like protein